MQCDTFYRSKAQGKAYIAYNRRFYESVIWAKKMINEDGGVKSFHFEFTELPKEAPTDDAGIVSELNILLFGNSSHVIDMAFFLGGIPSEMESFSCGTLAWSNEHERFAGAGKTKSGALFDYCANWGAPGRWGVEIMTAQRRLIFRPLERLQIQKINSFEVKAAEGIDYSLDTAYKPGIFRQVEAYLGLDQQNSSHLKTIEQQLAMLDIYEKIAGRKYH